MKLKLALLFLALASLACLETTIQATPAPAESVKPEASPQAASLDEPAAGAVFEPETWNVTPETVCALVTAEALHVRAEPDENGRVLHWLQAGDVVVITSEFQQWRGVTAGAITGYAHSAYLRETECE